MMIGGKFDPKFDPLERTQWSGKHEERCKDHYAPPEDATQARPLSRRSVLYLFYFVLFYYPSIW